MAPASRVVPQAVQDEIKQSIGLGRIVGGEGQAASPLVEGVTGRYFEDGNEAEVRKPGVLRGVAPYALDPDKAARLWQISEDALAR
jgi:hypothetical protein